MGSALPRQWLLKRASAQAVCGTTDCDHDGPIFPNLAKDVLPAGPNQLWVVDITHIAIATGFVHLAAILDAWSRRVVGLHSALGYRSPVKFEEEHARQTVKYPA